MSEQVDDGGPATEKTLLDEFAGKAMQALLASDTLLQLIYQNVPALEELDLFDNEGGLEIGTVIVRKQKLDTVVKFTVAVTI